MEENEVMTTELVDEENEYVDETDENSGIGTGLAMLIGSGITLAAVAVGNKLKKVWDKHKAKKGKSDEDGEDTIETEIVVDDSDRKFKRKK